MGLAGELLAEFEHMAEAITLIPSEGGRFEVTANGRLIYSKLATARHAQPGEVAALITKMMEG